MHTFKRNCEPADDAHTVFTLVINESIVLLKERWRRLLAVTLIGCAAMGLVGMFATYHVSTNMPRPKPTLQTPTAAVDPDTGLTSASTGTTTAPDTVSPLETASGVLFALTVFTIMGMTIFNIMLAALIRASAFHESLMDNISHAIKQLPRHGSQTGVFALPVLLLLLFVVMTKSMWVLIIMSMLMVPYSVAVTPLYMLASVECAMGSEDWLPWRSFHLFVTSPWNSLAVTLALSAGSSVLIVPIAGWALVVPYMMLFGPVVVMLHAALDDEHDATIEAQEAKLEAARMSLGMPAASVWDDPDAAHAAPEQVFDGTELRQQLTGQTPAAVHEGVLHPGMPAAEWIGTPVDGKVALRVSWSDGVPPSLAITDQLGNWQQLPPVDQFGLTVVELAAGWYTAHMTNVSTVSQTWRLEIFPPAQHSAA